MHTNCILLLPTNCSTGNNVPNKSYKYLLKRVKCAFSHICNSSEVHHSIKFILWKDFINLITSQVHNFSGAFSNTMLQSKLTFNTKLFQATRKYYKDTDFESPKSACINWSLPGSGNRFWRTLTAPKFPRDRLSCKGENVRLMSAVHLFCQRSFQ